jgi:hypothetical protein
LGSHPHAGSLVGGIFGKGECRNMECDPSAKACCFSGRHEFALNSAFAGPRARSDDDTGGGFVPRRFSQDPISLLQGGPQVLARIGGQREYRRPSCRGNPVGPRVAEPAQAVACGFVFFFAHISLPALFRREMSPVRKTEKKLVGFGKKGVIPVVDTSYRSDTFSFAKLSGFRNRCSGIG